MSGGGQQHVLEHVVLVRRTASLDDPRHAVGIAETRATQPDPGAEVLAADFAVLPDLKRRSAGDGPTLRPA